MSGEAELFALLKEVSRSFYISVRFLPKRIRLTIALGYLLARVGHDRGHKSFAAVRTNPGSGAAS